MQPSLAGGLLVVLLAAVQVGPARAYACASDAECQYEGCNDISCSGWESSFASCKNGVWSAICSSGGAYEGQCVMNREFDSYGSRPTDNTCPEPPSTTTSADPTTAKPATTPKPTMTTPGCEPVEKIIYKAWHEDPGRKDWGRPGHSHCVQPYAWDELLKGYKDKYIRYKVGGLGKLLEPGGYQTWVCLLDNHPCGDPHYCWVYHETDKVFVPWGTVTELGLRFRTVSTDAEPGSGSGSS